MKSFRFAVILLSAFLTVRVAYMQDVSIELQMPAETFCPGMNCYLDLDIDNKGPDSAVELFAAMTLGTGEYWFYPSWCHYPEKIDWSDLTLDGNKEIVVHIIPEFVWPAEVGSFSGAMFVSAIVKGDVLISNLAEYAFSWTETCSTPTPTPETPTAGPTATPTPTIPPAPDGFVMIPAGSFTMGSEDSEPCRDPDETLHQVTLTRSFYMLSTEVTRQMWADLKAVQPDLPDDPSNTQYSPTMQHPVQQVSWFESVLYANLLSLQHGFHQCYYKDAAFTVPVDGWNYLNEPIYCDFQADGYRLPTESEWEYACRAGTTGSFSCDEPDYTSDNCVSCDPGIHPVLENYCVYCCNVPDMSAPVGSKLPNPWNLFDMHGNVYEWCWDYYGEYPAGSVTDPTGAVSGDTRVRRGGAWYHCGARYCRSAYRHYVSANYRKYSLGFRIVQTVAP